MELDLTINPTRNPRERKGVRRKPVPRKGFQPGRGDCRRGERGRTRFPGAAWRGRHDFHNDPEAATIRGNLREGTATKTMANTQNSCRGGECAGSVSVRERPGFPFPVHGFEAVPIQ